MKYLYVLSLVAVTLVGCGASTITLTSNINDFVMMGIKTNSAEKVNVQVSSKVLDGTVKPYERDKTAHVSSHPGYLLKEGSTFKRMVSEYLGNKFPSNSPTGSTVIKISLDDFWLEMYTEASGGSQFATAMFGGETEYILSAKIKSSVTITRNGQQHEKIITATGEEKYIRGVGTGTKTSNIYQGSDSPEAVYARAINSANNKVLMMLNVYFQELGL